MNYRKLYLKFVAGGYLESEDDSKLAKVGLKVVRRMNRQAVTGSANKAIEYIKRDPIWLSLY